MDRIVLPEIPTYVREKDKRQMPSPQWATMISVIDGKLMKPSELDPATVKFVQKLCKGLTIADLRNHFETKRCVEGMTQTASVDITPAPRFAHSEESHAREKEEPASQDSTFGQGTPAKESVEGTDLDTSLSPIAYVPDFEDSGLDFELFLANAQAEIDHATM